MIAGHCGLLKMGSSSPKKINPNQILNAAKQQINAQQNGVHERSVSTCSRPSLNCHTNSRCFYTYSLFENQRSLSPNVERQERGQYMQKYRQYRLHEGHYIPVIENRTSFAAHFSNGFLNSTCGSTYFRQKGTVDFEKRETSRRGPWIPFDATKKNRPLKEKETALNFESMERNNSPLNLEHSSTSSSSTASTCLPELSSSYKDLNSTTDLNEKDQCRKTRCSQSESLRRKWIDCKHKSSPGFSNKAEVCSVLSYNILSQTLLENNRHLYKHCDQTLLSWIFRWNNIQKELSDYRPDVICLQEVEEEHYNKDIFPWFKAHGYTCTYKKRTGNHASKPDGVLTACLSSKLEIVKTKPVEYFRNHSDTLASWHNVGIINVMRLVSSKKEPSLICVGNTHLVYNPRRGDVKLTQLATFFAELARVVDDVKKSTGYQPPLILCGDYNSTPFSPLYNMITTGVLNYEGLATTLVSGQHVKSRGRLMPPDLFPRCLNIDENCSFIDGDESVEPKNSNLLQHRLGQLVSAWEHRQYEATTMQDRGITVDYIFYSSDQSPPHSKYFPKSKISRSDENLSSSAIAKSNANDHNSNSMAKISEQKEQRKLLLTLKRRYSPCTGKDIYNVHGIPNSVHSSDHLPVLAEFYVTKS